MFKNTNDNINIYGTDDCEEIQLMYEDWSYGEKLFNVKKLSMRNRLRMEYEEDVVE